MSRVGKKPILIPEKTKVSYENRVLTVQGAKGTLTRPIHPAVDLKIENGVLNVVVLEDKRTSRALQGLTRSLVANMMMGVNKGFERTPSFFFFCFQTRLHSICRRAFPHPLNGTPRSSYPASIKKNWA